MVDTQTPISKVKLGNQEIPLQLLGGRYNIKVIENEDGTQSFEIADAEGDGVDEALTVASAKKCEIALVGANTVANPVMALEYFGYTAPYPNLTIIALDALSANNEFGYFTSQQDSNGVRWWRMRDGAINWPSTFNNSWDTRLVAGSRYLVIEW